MSGDGAGGNVDDYFGSPHGLIPGSPIAVVDTTAGTHLMKADFLLSKLLMEIHHL